MVIAVLTCKDVGRIIKVLVESMSPSVSNDLI
jgi:hypothetical protein